LSEEWYFDLLYQFYILSSTGKGYFAAGKIILDNSGIHIRQNSGTRFLLFETSGGSEVSGIYTAGTQTIWYTPSGKSIQIGREGQSTTPQTTELILMSQTISIVNDGESPTGYTKYKFPSGIPAEDEVLTVSGYSGVTATLAWAAGSGSSSFPLLAENGSAGAPSYSFDASGTTGMYRHSTPTLAFSFEGSAKVHMFSEMELGFALDMNNWAVYDAYEVRCRSGGAYNNPTFTWDDAGTSGMYYDSGVAITVGSSTKMKWTTGTTWTYRNISPGGVGIDMGSSYNRYATIYCATLNESSDAALKENMLPLTKEKGLDFITSLNPIQYNMIDDSEIHTGFTAQHIKEKALAQGYTDDFGLYSEKTEEDGTVSWGLVYRDLIAPLVASVKELKDRIEILEGGQ